MERRQLGSSGIEVSAIGVGTWAIGGAMLDPAGEARSWGVIDDTEVVDAMRWALDNGITFFDTSNNYGCGHAEQLVGRATQGEREKTVLATKFGYVCKPGTRIIEGSDVSEAAIRTMLKQSLQNLKTDYIDLYQLHVYDLPLDEALRVRDLLEVFVQEGQIRAYGWSCNEPERAQLFAQGDHCATIQHHYNLLERTQRTFDVCRQAGVTTIARGPLGMGLLTGKYTKADTMSKDDFRSDWNLSNGKQADQIETLASLRRILTREGHTLPQAALAWLLSTSAEIVPIPGFKSLEQLKENVGVLDRGLLSSSQMHDLETALTPEVVTYR